MSPLTGFPFCSYCHLSQNWTSVSRIPHEISQCILNYVSIALNQLEILHKVFARTMYILFRASIPLPSHCHPLGNRSSLHSQNLEWVTLGGTAEGPSSPTSLLQQGPLGPVTQDCDSMAFEYLPCYPSWAARPFPVPALSPRSSRLTNGQVSPRKWLLGSHTSVVLPH